MVVYVCVRCEGMQGGVVVYVYVCICVCVRCEVQGARCEVCV